MKLNYERTRNNGQFLYDLGNVYSTSDLINRLVNVDAIANVKTESEDEKNTKAAFQCVKLIVDGQVLYDLNILKPIHDNLVNAANDLKAGEASDEEKEEAKVRFDAINSYNEVFKSFVNKLSQLPQELNHLPNEFVEITADGFNESVEIKLNLEDYRQMLKNDSVAYQLSFKSASDRALVVAKLDDFADYEAKLAELIDDDIWKQMNPEKQAISVVSEVKEKFDNTQGEAQKPDPAKRLKEQLDNLLKTNSADSAEEAEAPVDDAENAPIDDEDKSSTNDAENAPTDDKDKSSTNDDENAPTAPTDGEENASTNDDENAPKENADAKSSDGEEEAEVSTNDAENAENAQTNDDEKGQAGAESSTDGEENVPTDDEDSSQSNSEQKSSTDDAENAPTDGEDDQTKAENDLAKRLDDIEAKLSQPKENDTVNKLLSVLLLNLQNNLAVKPAESSAIPKVQNSFEAQDAALANDTSWMSGLLDED